jgi:hypothetical protein
LTAKENAFPVSVLPVLVAYSFVLGFFELPGCRLVI